MAIMTKPAPPDHLTMDLFAPGMSALHRAGLGGLACTLKAMERQYESGLLNEKKLPVPFNSDRPPWDITERSVTLKFGKPDNAGDYLKKLFAFAFQIRDGIIYLPGQYSDPPPPLPVRAEMQTALSRTFLQGAKKNIGLEPSVPYFVDPDGDGTGAIEIQFQKCNWFLHQRLWKAFVDDDSTLLESPKKTMDGKNVNFGSLYSGAIKRHDVHSESEVSETVSRLMSSIFFVVGCLANRLSTSGDGVQLIPEVENLAEFLIDRPFMAPRTVSEVRVGGVADAAFQMEVRVRTAGILLASNISSCRAQRFSLRTWTKPQKSRVDAIEISTTDISRVEPERSTDSERSFAQFERAMAVLPRGLRTRKDGTAYWSDSVVRPFIADNLAVGRRWYESFHLIANTVSKRQKLSYERKELSNMTSDNTMLDDSGEKVVIESVHAAILCLRGQIGDIYGDRLDLMYKKFNAETEKWCRIFAGSMSLPQFRKSLTDLFRRAGRNQVLQERWKELLPMLRKETWEHARDLTLIGLCSYAGKDKVNQNKP